MLKRRQVQILKAMERVLNQNRYQELIHSKDSCTTMLSSNSSTMNISFSNELDFKYFEDKTDEARDPMGTLFPLWKFPPSVPDRSVTALAWNPAYSDMIIIGYGLCKVFVLYRTLDLFALIDDRAKRVPGTIALFTLNNSYPDTLIQTESTVLSIDCLPSKP